MAEADARRPLLAPPRPPERRRRLALLVAVAAALALLTAALALAAATNPTNPTNPTNTTAVAGPLERHFATKTAYWDQRRGGETAVAPLPSRPSARRLRNTSSSTTIDGDGADVFHGLRLVQTQLVTRHGIRFPTSGPIRDAEALIRKLAPFAAALPQWMRGYALPYNASVEGALADAGAREMERLARRQLADHGKRAPATYARDAFQLSHTHVARTKDSAVAFAREYFTNPNDVRYVERPKDNDTLLRFFDACPRYQNEVKRNKSALREMLAFANSTAMAAARQSLARALRVDAAAVRLTTRDLAAAFSACAFDVALYGILDQWCALFTPAMVAALDYDDDLKAFYQLAGGFAINYEMAAVLLQDVVAVMDARVAGRSAIEGAFRFAHAETTLPLMTLLGFGAKTPPLTAAATSEQIAARGFRTSVLAPFAANVEFRLYERSDGQHFVQVLVNERDDVQLPGCGAALCPLTTLKTSLWRKYLYEYDFAQQCRA